MSKRGQRERRELGEVDPAMGEQRIGNWEPMSFGGQTDKIPGALRYLAAVKLFYSYGYRVTRMLATPAAGGPEYVADVFDRASNEPRGRRALDLKTRKIRTIAVDMPALKGAA